MLYTKDAMTAKLITIHPTDSLKMAREIMLKARIRHLPVLSPKGGFIGLLTQRDLFKASISHFADFDDRVRDEIEDSIPVSEVMSVDIVTIDSDMLLSKAGELMLTNKFGCLPVVDHGELVGLLTEADFIKVYLAIAPKYPDADSCS